MREVVKKEVLKLLKAGVIYPVSESEWIRPIQVVPKKGGMTVIHNEKNELIPQQTVTSWRMCIDYQKLVGKIISRYPSTTRSKMNSFISELPPVGGCV
jgi:hypothetical protein